MGIVDITPAEWDAQRKELDDLLAKARNDRTMADLLLRETQLRVERLGRRPDERVATSFVTPRRSRVDQWTPTEHAISIAVDAVERMPPDVRLTDAVILLQAAQDSVADFVDGVTGKRRAVTPYSEG